MPNYLNAHYLDVLTLVVLVVATIGLVWLINTSLRELRIRSAEEKKEEARKLRRRLKAIEDALAERVIPPGTLNPVLLVDARWICIPLSGDDEDEDEGPMDFTERDQLFAQGYRVAQTTVDGEFICMFMIKEADPA